MIFFYASHNLGAIIKNLFIRTIEPFRGDRTHTDHVVSVFVKLYFRDCIFLKEKPGHVIWFNSTCQIQKSFENKARFNYKFDKSPFFNRRELCEDGICPVSEFKCTGSVTAETLNSSCSALNPSGSYEVPDAIFWFDVITTIIALQQLYYSILLFCYRALPRERGNFL